MFEDEVSHLTTSSNSAHKSPNSCSNIFNNLLQNQKVNIPIKK